PIEEPEVFEAPEPVAPEPVVVAEAPKAEPVVELPPAAPEPIAAAPAAPVEAPKPSTAGRIVPPTLRLRIEEQRPTTPTAALPTNPVPRSAPRLAPKPKTPAPAVRATGTLAPGGSAARPGPQGARPAGTPMPPRPSGPR